MDQSKPEPESNNRYIVCSKCKMIFFNDDEHISIGFGYDRLNISYKQCVQCRTYQAEYRAKYRDEFREQNKKNIIIIMKKL